MNQLVRVEPSELGRECKECHETKPLNGDFFPRLFNKKRNKYNYRRSCKKCYCKKQKGKRNQYQKKYYEKNKEKMLKQMNDRYKLIKTNSLEKKENKIIQELKIQLDYYEKKLKNRVERSETPQEDSTRMERERDSTK